MICLVDKCNGFSEPVRVLTPHSEHCAGLNWSREGGEKASNNPSSCLEEKSLQLRQSCGQFPRHPFSDTLVWPKWNHRKLPGKEKSSVSVSVIGARSRARSCLRKLQKPLNQTNADEKLSACSVIHHGMKMVA